jgi:hypothetical protein
MSRLTIFLIISFALIACKQSVPPSHEEYSTALNVCLDSGLRATYENKILYDIRGNFIADYTDSLIASSLSAVDSIITKEDVDFMIQQYNYLKTSSLDGYIDNSKYRIKEGAHYTPMDSVNYQFILSPPLYSIDKKFFVTFCVGTGIRPNSFTDGFFFLFINEDNSWYLHSIIKSDFTTPSNIKAEQSHSFIPL